MRYHVDTTADSTVAVCECGARLLGSNELAVRRALAAHETLAHPAHKNARAGLAQACRRAH